jgi:hypothetical protein
MFANVFPRGTVDGLRFTLTEFDLRADKLLVHLNVENLGNDPRFEQEGRERGLIRIGLTCADGTTLGYAAIRVKEPTGKSGAFVMEFQRSEIPVPTFSLLVNDQPLFSGVNLRQLRFQSF